MTHIQGGVVLPFKNLVITGVSSHIVKNHTFHLQLIEINDLQKERRISSKNNSDVIALRLVTKYSLLHNLMYSAIYGYHEGKLTIIIIYLCPSKQINNV